MTDLRVSERILQTISTWIACGELSEDGALPTLKRLSEMFNVSIVTVREAVIGLETLGVVQMKHGKGVYVVSPETIIEDMFQTRREMESAMTRRAAGMISPAALGQLEARVSAMQQAAERADADEYGRYDTFFHDIIYRASESEIMRKIVTLLKSGVFSPGFHTKVELSKDSGYLIRANRDHWALYQAMVERDPFKGEIAVHNHLDRVFHAWKRNLGSMRQVVKSELAQMI